MSLPVFLLFFFSFRPFPSAGCSDLFFSQAMTEEGWTTRPQNDLMMMLHRSKEYAGAQRSDPTA